MALKDIPIIGNLASFSKKDGTEMTNEEAAEAMCEADKAVEAEPKKAAAEAYLIEAGYGKDAGDKLGWQAGTAICGAVSGAFIGYKASGGKPLPAIIGVFVGSVVLHKIGPELITDIQRGNQYVDQQKALGKSEGKLSDRFNAVIDNIKVRGQNTTPDPDIDVDV